VNPLNLRKGSVVDIYDPTTSMWYIACVLRITGNKVLLHYWGWDHQYNETVERNSPRLAQIKTHSYGTMNFPDSVLHVSKCTICQQVATTFGVSVKPPTPTPDLIDARDKKGSWFPAVVVNTSQQNGKPIRKVHFYGWSSTYEESIEDASSIAEFGSHKLSYGSLSDSVHLKVSGCELCARIERHFGMTTLFGGYPFDYWKPTPLFFDLTKLECRLCDIITSEADLNRFCLLCDEQWRLLGYQHGKNDTELDAVETRAREQNVLPIKILLTEWQRLEASAKSVMFAVKNLNNHEALEFLAKRLGELYM
jgi:hypothetical protein